MNTKIKTMLAVGGLLGILAIASPAAAAQWPGNCKQAQAAAANRIKAYATHRDDYVSRYEQIVERSQNLTKALRSKGYDEKLIDQLEADLVILKTKVQKFDANVTAAVKTLEEANDYRCGKSEGEYAGRIREAKDLLAVARSDVKDMRNYVVTTIKADLQALRHSPRP